MKSKLSLRGDKVIWSVIVILFVVSLAAVYSSTGSLAYKYRDGNTLFYLFRHLTFLAAGFGIIYIVHKIHYMWFSRFAPVFFYTAVILLAFTLVLGTEKNDASRWLTLPGLGIAFQTSDLGKFALVLYVARVLSQHQGRKRDLNKAFKQIMIGSGLICGLIVPENLSTAGMLFFIVLLMMYIGRMPMKYIYRAVMLVAAGLFIFVLIALVSPSKGRVVTWMNRVEGFFNPDSKSNYQAEHAKIAVATGGFTGKNPGNSTQRNFLPHPYSDFIYAIIIEEYGSIPAIILMFIYTIFVFRIGTITRRSPTAFPSLFASGLAIGLVLQAFVNMAVSVNLIPVTGQPLPFVSMGGTSILFTSITFGILLGISGEVYVNRESVAMKSDV